MRIRLIKNMIRKYIWDDLMRFWILIWAAIILEEDEKWKRILNEYILLNYIAESE
jgi:hypothetical protein